MSRVCLSPSVASNGESFAVAGALRLAAGHGVRGGVVTYADPVARLRTLPDGRTAGSPRGHLGIIYQALSATYTGRSTARTVIVPPDGQVLPARSMKFVASDRGADGFERRIVALGASERPAGAGRRAWLHSALEQIGARRSRHPGTHRFCGQVSCVAASLMTVPGCAAGTMSALQGTLTLDEDSSS